MKIRYIKFIRTLAILALVSSIYSSCSEDFLEVTPNGVLIAETTNDYDLLLNYFTIYSANEVILRSFEVCALEPHWTGITLDEYYKNLFRWEAETSDPSEGENVVTALKASTEILYVHNKVINEVPNAIGSEADKNRILAHARAVRALVNFRFVNYYGKPYNVATAATDLGIPIITAADVTQESFTRASVQEVYDFILEDINAAIPNLPLTAAGNTRMTKGAAKGLLAKVYIYMNRFNDALPLLNEALTDIQAESDVDWFNYNVTTQPGGIHAAGFIGPPNILPVDNIEAVYSFPLGNNFGFSSDDVLLSPEVSALYGDSDLRLHHFFSRKTFPALPFTPEFSVPGVYRRGSLPFSDGGIRLPDLYLLRAECNARSNNLNAAIEDLEVLRNNRMAPADAAVPSGLSQDDLIKFVIDERTREFAIKSELWFDMRRLWNDPLFQDRKPYTHTIYNADGSVQETFTLEEDRLVLRFSEKIMTENPGMVNNP